MGFGNVVERHHDERQEQHRWNGADPIPVRRQDAVLISGSGPAHQFESPQIGGEKAETSHPCRHLAAGHKEIFAGIRPTLQIESDGQNQKEIERDNHHIHGGQVHELLFGKHRYRWDHFFSLSFGCP